MGDAEQVKEIGAGPHFALPKPFANWDPTLPSTRRGAYCRDECRLWADAVEKSLRTPANSDSGDSMDWVMEAGMMGRRSDQGSLFYQFRLDERVPKGHLLRRIDGFVAAALADIHERLQPYYSEVGRAAVDPELMIRMLIVGYCYGLR